MITFSIWKESVVLFFDWGVERTADLPTITQPFSRGTGAQLQASLHHLNEAELTFRGSAEQDDTTCYVGGPASKRLGVDSGPLPTTLGGCVNTTLAGGLQRGASLSEAV